MKTIIFLIGCFIASFSFAQEFIPTELVVRAKAKDAKFIGSSVGGAFIRIKNADTGEVLVEGLTEGSTGNSNLIMKKPKGRYDTIGDGAASFSAILNISQPVFLTVEVLTPYIKRQAHVLSQTQTWLVPGKPIDGEGLVVEVPGMIVDVLSPNTHIYTSIANSPFEIKANVVMMCGCVITNGGLWDGEQLDVSAIIYKDGEYFQTIKLAMQNDMNIFRAEFVPDSPANYRVLVYSYDPKTGNTGVDQTSFVVTK